MGSIEATRNAWGRNNFLTFEIHGEKGSICFNYERRDELQVCFSDDPDDRRGFRTIYTGAAVRGRLAASFGKDLPAALIEDAVAVIGAVLIVGAVA